VDAAASAVAEVELTSFAPPLNPENPLTMLPELLQHALVLVHDTTGLPWWASIIVLTVSVRAALFPIAVSQTKNAAGQQMAQPELAALDDEMMKVNAAYQKLGQAVPLNVTQDHRARRSGIMKKHGVSMAGMFKNALIQMPVFMSFYWAIRSMAHVDPTFCVGGFGLGSFDWSNLAELDGTYVLPLVNAAFQLVSAKLNSENAPAAMKKFVYVMVGVGLLFSTTQAPVGVLLYWSAQNAFIIAQGQLLKRDAVRKRLGIPIVTLSDQQKADQQKRQAEQMNKLWGMVRGQKAEPPASSVAATNPFAAKSAYTPPSAETAAAAAAALGNTQQQSKAAAFYGNTGSSSSGGRGGQRGGRKR